MEINDMRVIPYPTKCSDNNNNEDDFTKIQLQFAKLDYKHYMEALDSVQVCIREYIELYPDDPYYLLEDIKKYIKNNIKKYYGSCIGDKFFQKNIPLIIENYFQQPGRPIITIRKKYNNFIDYCNDEYNNRCIECYIDDKHLDEKGIKIFKSIDDYWNYYIDEINVELYEKFKHKWGSKYNYLNTTEFVLDHKGNKFPTISDKCDYYGVPMGTYYNRLNTGWSEKECLEGRWIYDENGNKYHSLKAMKKANKKSKLKVTWTDCLNNTFNTEKEMIEFYNCKEKLYYKRKYKGYTREECLGIEPHIFEDNVNIIHTYLTDNLYLERIKNINGILYCDCLLDNAPVVLRSEVVKYICREYNIERIIKLHKNDTED